MLRNCYMALSWKHNVHILPTWAPPPFPFQLVQLKYLLILVFGKSTKNRTFCVVMQNLKYLNDSPGAEFRSNVLARWKFGLHLVALCRNCKLIFITPQVVTWVFFTRHLSDLSILGWCSIQINSSKTYLMIRK